MKKLKESTKILEVCVSGTCFIDIMKHFTDIFGLLELCHHCVGGLVDLLLMVLGVGVSEDDGCGVTADT